MPRETVLVGASAEVRFASGTTITGVTGAGAATQFTPSRGGLRSADLPSEIDTSPEFERALHENGIYEQETIHLDLSGSAERLRGGAGAPDRLVLRPAIPDGDTAPRVVLYQDESGGLSWHFARDGALTDEERARARRRGLRLDGGAAGEFRIPLRNSSTRRAMEPGLPRRSLRGPITKIGRKILKVLIVPLAGLIGDPVQDIVGVIERRHRRNLVWRMTPDNYQRPPTEAVSDWSDLKGQRALLVVHGILSTAEAMLSSLPEAAMRRWCEAYEGRVLAFNHLSVTQSPEDNARFFLEHVKAALPGDLVEFDVLCHSRGGIVSRVLSERGPALVPETNCRFASMFFVATPNQGSVLGDPEHIVDMLDVFTNFLTAFPDGPILYSIEVLLSIVKVVATAAGTRLPGIAAMGTDDYISRVLNAQPTSTAARYGAAASDYTPAAGNDNGYLLWRFADALGDRVFRKDGDPVANDLVVPFDGVWSANGHPSFPIDNPLLFKPAQGVWHTGFFARAETVAHIDRHLGLVPPVVPMITRPARPRRGGLRGGEGGGRAGDSRDAPGPVTVQREPRIEFHEQVMEGQTWPLTVSLDEAGQRREVEQLISLLLAAGEDQVELTVDLSAPGFEVQGKRYATITVKRERDPSSEQAVFLLKAAPPGPEPMNRTIIAAFWQGNNCIGSVSHNTSVVPTGYTGPYVGDGGAAVDALRLSPQKREASDLVIYVRRVAKLPAETYEVALRCQVSGEEYETRPFGEFDLGSGEISKYLGDAVDPAFRRFPADLSLSDDEFERQLSSWNADLVTTLRDLGKRLWTLLPQGFRDEYLRLMSLPFPPRSICVHSDEMIVPWEIVRPSGRVGPQYVDLPPLGIAHVLGRWKTGLGTRPQPQAVAAPRLVILTPEYEQDGLANAAEERDALLRLLPRPEVLTPVTRPMLDRLLERSDLQMVHFTGHGDWDTTTNADLASLRLEQDDTIPAIGFASCRLGALAHPILFLNACTIGRVAQVLGHPGGFAANCLAGGWSGVIAPYWPVYDPKASEFSRKLYEKLRFGRSVGEALQELRAEAPEDPTALSYSYFGDPWARLLFR